MTRDEMWLCVALASLVYWLIENRLGKLGKRIREMERGVGDDRA